MHAGKGRVRGIEEEDRFLRDDGGGHLENGSLAVREPLLAAPGQFRRCRSGSPVPRQFCWVDPVDGEAQREGEGNGRVGSRQFCGVKVDE